ncbi:hypothetical protein [Rossellomorea sp. BNER]
MANIIISLVAILLIYETYSRHYQINIDKKARKAARIAAPRIN